MLKVIQRGKAMGGTMKIKINKPVSLPTQFHLDTSNVRQHLGPNGRRENANKEYVANLSECHSERLKITAALVLVVVILLLLASVTEVITAALRFVSELTYHSLLEIESISSHSPQR